jgi:hypothetical protein
MIDEEDLEEKENYAEEYAKKELKKKEIDIEKIKAHLPGLEGYSPCNDEQYQKMKKVLNPLGPRISIFMLIPLIFCFAIQTYSCTYHMNSKAHTYELITEIAIMIFSYTKYNVHCFREAFLNE